MALADLDLEDYAEEVQAAVDGMLKVYQFLVYIKRVMNSVRAVM